MSSLEEPTPAPNEEQKSELPTPNQPSNDNPGKEEALPPLQGTFESQAEEQAPAPAEEEAPPPAEEEPQATAIEEATVPAAEEATVSVAEEAPATVTEEASVPEDAAAAEDVHTPAAEEAKASEESPRLMMEGVTTGKEASASDDVPTADVPQTVSTAGEASNDGISTTDVISTGYAPAPAAENEKAASQAADDTPEPEKQTFFREDTAENGTSGTTSAKDTIATEMEKPERVLLPKAGVYYIPANLSIDPVAPSKEAPYQQYLDSWKSLMKVAAGKAFDGSEDEDPFRLRKMLSFADTAEVVDKELHRYGLPAFPSKSLKGLGDSPEYWHASVENPN